MSHQPSSASDHTTVVDDRHGAIPEASTERAAYPPSAFGTAPDYALSRKTWRDHLPVPLRAPIEALWPLSLPEGTHPFIVKCYNRAKWRRRKNLLRVNVALLLCFIITLEERTLEILGSAAFFAMITCVAIPPTMPVIMFLLASSLLMLGLLFAWAWCCLVLKCATAARSVTLLASQVETVAQTIQGLDNPDALYSKELFHGAFYDPRCTAVVACLFFVGCCAMGYIRATYPKLIIFAIFGSIMLDVVMSYAPYYPFANYSLANSLTIPTAFYMALSIGTTLLMFPQTLNAAWTQTLIDGFLIPVFKRSQLHNQLLRTPPPTNEASAQRWSKLHNQFESTGAVLSASLTSLLGEGVFMEFEVSYGRLGAKDLIGMSKPLQKLLSRSMGLGVVGNWIHHRHRRSSARHSAPSPPAAAPGSRLAAHQESVEKARREAKLVEESHGHDLASLLPILEASSANLRYNCDDTLMGTMAWLDSVNHTRWWGRPSRERMQQALEAQKNRISSLETAIASFRKDGRAELCAPFSDLFDPVTGEELAVTPQRHCSTRSLFLCLAASANLIWYAEAVLGVARILEELEGKRTTYKLWWPGRIRRLGNIVTGMARGGGGGGADAFSGDSPSGDPDNVQQVDGDQQDDQDWKEEQAAYDAMGGHNHKDPDAKPPKNIGQHIGAKIFSVLAWCHSPVAVFTFKYGLLSVLIWSPTAFRHSAFFAYDHKTLWSIIMAQTCLSVWAGEQWSAQFQKLIGTVFGCAWAVMIWYMGSGHGTGSRPGLGTAFFVFTLPAMALRIFCPHSWFNLATMIPISTVLIVGYSWDDAHLATINPGSGWSPGWQRTVEVIVGQAAAAIVMLLPSPPSARKLVRRTHATCIREIDRIYAGMVGSWLKEHHDEERSGEKEVKLKGPSKQAAAAEERSRSRLLALYLKIKALHAGTHEAGFEFSFRGAWPHKEYKTLLGCETEILEAMSQVAICIYHSDSRWRSLMVQRSSYLSPSMISDITSAFYSVALALKNGTPLHEGSHGPLFERLNKYEARRKRKMESDQRSNHIDGGSVAFHFTYDVIKDERFGIHATALLALGCILENLDEMEHVTKTLVGEVSFKGYLHLEEETEEDEALLK